MPSYKTHSIHGELVFNDMEKRIDLDLEDLKSFAMGPDTLINSDFKTFKLAHRYRVKDYYILLLKLIKDKKLLDNKEVMAFLYGQLDHFVLDAITHPLICYMTEGETPKYSTKPHGLCEMWIDDYIMQLYDATEKFYYNKNKIGASVKELITELNGKIYGSENAGESYEKGMKTLNIFDSFIRGNLILITPLATKLAKVGPIAFSKDTTRILPYINSERDIWFDPETLEQHTESFMDLFYKAQNVALETIDDVNKHLYDGKPLTNPLILNNTSYNTGINCELGQHFARIRN
ncbi:MAG: zinc dependent phospholipase C family protein [Bacilli bacterium]|nr:zinc dependent phospholipase C family protein [Bacilli bacterium]